MGGLHSDIDKALVILLFVRVRKQHVIGHCIPLERIIILFLFFKTVDFNRLSDFLLKLQV